MVVWTGRKNAQWSVGTGTRGTVIQQQPRLGIAR
jgi:hypothetical protein